MTKLNMTDPLQLETLGEALHYQFWIFFLFFSFGFFAHLIPITLLLCLHPTEDECTQPAKQNTRRNSLPKRLQREDKFCAFQQKRISQGTEIGLQNSNQSSGAYRGRSNSVPNKIFIDSNKRGLEASLEEHRDPKANSSIKIQQIHQPSYPSRAPIPSKDHRRLSIDSRIDMSESSSQRIRRVVFSLSFGVLMLNMISLLLRMIWCLDPREGAKYPFDLFAKNTRVVLLKMPQYFWMAGTLTLVLYWRSTLIKLKKIHLKMPSVKLFQAASLLTCLIIILSFPFSLLYANGVISNKMDLIANSIISGCMLLLTLGGLFYARKLKKTVTKQIQKIQLPKESLSSLNRIQKSMLILSLCAIVIVVVIFWHTFNRDTPIKYFIFWTIVHSIELVSSFTLSYAMNISGIICRSWLRVKSRVSLMCPRMIPIHLIPEENKTKFQTPIVHPSLVLTTTPSKKGLVNPPKSPKIVSNNALLLESSNRQGSKNLLNHPKENTDFPLSVQSNFNSINKNKEINHTPGENKNKVDNAHVYGGHARNEDKSVNSTRDEPIVESHSIPIPEPQWEISNVSHSLEAPSSMDKSVSSSTRARIKANSLPMVQKKCNSPILRTETIDHEVAVRFTRNRSTSENVSKLIQQLSPKFSFRKPVIDYTSIVNSDMNDFARYSPSHSSIP